MYDIVSGSFFANAGSGQFLKGNDILTSSSAEYVGVATLNDITAAENCVDIESEQEVGGVKTFTQRPLVKVGAALLPEKYQQIEYVESTGTQYIDTGFTPASYENVTAEVQYLYTVIPGDPNPYAYVMGVRGSSTDRFDLIGMDRATQYTRIGTARSAPTGINIKTYEKYTQSVNVRSHTLTINGASYGMTYESPTTVQSPLRLFSTSQNDGSGSMWNMSGRVYYCKLYENDELVRDYVPAYDKETKEVGMYDLISNTFYTNQGTESFIAGKDVNAEIFGVATLQDIENAYPEIIDLTE